MADKKTANAGSGRGRSSGRGRGRSRNRGGIRVLIKESSGTPVRRSSRSRGKKSTKTSPRKTNAPARKRSRSKSRPPARRGASKPKKTPSKNIPPVGDNIRIIPLGGVEEIGRNITAIETGDDIVIVDAGHQFSEAETPGIDYILPNISYLKENKNKVRALLITHGHLDHIGAVPYVAEQLDYPPIYSREFGAMMIKKRQEEFPHMKPLDIRIVKENQTITAGKMKIETFAISHAIPDSMGLIIDTPHGKIVYVADVRVDHKDGAPTKEEVERYKRFKNEKVLFFTLDSTRVETPGWSTPESEAIETIDTIIKDAPARIIIGTFASQVERIMQFIKAAEKYDRKVVVDGRSMKANVEIIKHLNLLKAKNIIPIDEMENHPPNKILVLATGAQGEEFAVLMRAANKSHKYLKLNKTDTIILSSSVIPGNESSITKLKDNLYRSEARVVTYLTEKVHAGGHGYRGELEWIHKQIPYTFFMPVHGHHYMLRMHAELSESLGTPKANIAVPDNGSIVEIQDKGKKLTILKETVPADPVMVDGFSIGDVQDVVLRDRQTLAEEGMFIIVASINPKTGKLRKSPDIISRGFVYLRESQELLSEARGIIKTTIESTTRGMYPINFDYVKNAVTDNIRKFLLQKTDKSPVVIPVIIGV